MVRWIHVAAGTIVTAGLMMGTAAWADHHTSGSHGTGPGGTSHGTSTPHGSYTGSHGSFSGTHSGPSGFSGMHTGPGGFSGTHSTGPSGYHGTSGFHGTSHYSMPSSGFHGVPPDFHGHLTHGGPAPSRSGHHIVGGPGHDLGRFHGHDYAHFSDAERYSWRHGEWRHAYHNGHYGWWWYADDNWFFYPAPIYPYPLYVGSEDYYDYYDENGSPDYYWYYCEDPPGYYPYVQNCNVPWEPVPPGDQ